MSPLDTVFDDVYLGAGLPILDHGAIDLGDLPDLGNVDANEENGDEINVSRDPGEIKQEASASSPNVEKANQDKKLNERLRRNRESAKRSREGKRAMHRALLAENARLQNENAMLWNRLVSALPFATASLPPRGVKIMLPRLRPCRNEP